MTTATATEPETETKTAVFRVLAADKLAPEGLAWIEEQPDAQLDNKPGLSEDELAQIAGQYDAMIVRSGVQVTAKILESGAFPNGRLKVVARAGVGVDNIDIPAATARGVLVLNTAEASTLTTAEHAFTLMLALLRNIGPAYKTMTEGGWDRAKFKGRQLAGKTVGVVGFGRIGQTVAARALAFETQVVAYDPFYNAQTALDGQVRMFRSFEDMLPHADILTFHVPLNDHTRGMLNRETFAKARKGVYVVNASRGGVVDEQALLEAIESGQCGGAALDVYASEPPAKDDPLRTHPKVLLTPHLGASTQEAQQAVSVDAGISALAYLRGEGLRGAVNAGGVRVDLDPFQQRYVDLAQRMAELINPMITRGIAEVRIELAGKDLVAAAGTIERTVLIALLKGHLDIPLNLINVCQVAQQRGIKSRTVNEEPSETVAPGGGGGPHLTLDIQGPPEAVDEKTPPQDHTRRIVGRVYDDLRPRIVEINGYRMDMVPAGHMVLIQNEDQPGVIGVVGSEFGEAGVNIADMSISRRPSRSPESRVQSPESETMDSGRRTMDSPGGKATALMVLKIDNEAPEALINRLKARPGILKVAVVALPQE